MILSKSSILLLPIILAQNPAAAFVPAPQRISPTQNALPIISRSPRIYSTSEDHADGVNGVASQVAETDGDQATTTVATETSSSTKKAENPQAVILKTELLNLAEKLNRGFQATRVERDQMKDLVFQLAPLNPTAEPASPYYSDGVSKKSNSENSNTLAGKWTLVYTDAPDITGLDTSRNPLSTSQLGRIGQECSPPYIKNVIEWKRPEWARNLPLSGGDETRVLQKVVTSASASPEKPKIVNLKVAGLELESGSSGDSATDLTSRIQKDGLLAGLLSANPVDLKGPLNPPFGQFEVLYLDDELRIIKTYQNYLAINRRIKEGEEWF